MIRYTKKEGLDLGQRMFACAPRWRLETWRLQSMYSDGLTAGWCQCGLINDVEMCDLRDQLRVVEPKPKEKPSHFAKLRRVARGC